MKAERVAVPRRYLGGAVSARLAAVAVVVVFAGLRLADPPFVEAIRDKGFDLEQRLAPRGDEGLPAPIVAIDEASLRKYGQWPWPRTLLARLVRRIGDGKPAVLGVDIVFAEPDRMSPERLADELPGLPPAVARALADQPSGDAALAQAFQSVPTVLGLDAMNERQDRPAQRLRTALIRQAGPDPTPFLPHFPYLLASIPELVASGTGAAVLVAAADGDGIVRCMPLFVDAGGRILPGLALEMVRIATGGGTLGVETGHDGVAAGVVAGLRVPTDRDGRACIHFSPSYAGRYVSAADLLDGTVDPARFAGKAVLLGLTGAGLLDLKQTPLGPTQGVEVHAQLIESMLAGSLLRALPRPGPSEAGLILATGLLAVLALPGRRPAIAGAALVPIVAGAATAAFAGFVYADLMIDPILPSLAAVSAFGVMQGASLRRAEASRRRLTAELQREREVKARLDGELYVARAIQMGLLPHHFPGPPARLDVEMHALLEPARMVGGDLYDFLFLDMRRLFFAVADVSGKGVPAALFMAMSKEVLRAAAVQHGESLDRVFAAANEKISSASGDMLAEGADMMFVTVFAGVLDLVTGMLVYACAGHDAPLLLRGGTPVGEIASVGGPPLGTVDDFPYPVDRRQLDRGDLVLVFTDGVSEADDDAGNLYGVARLRGMAATLLDAAPRVLVDEVREDVKRFASGTDQADDITLMAIRWLGPPGGQ
jgi:serine phosphatase RsbU (regulator of sigma subunit)/CHASE2 domain-containing sensor protein